MSLSAGTVEINADNNLGSGSPNDVDAIAANSINIRFEGGALRVASGSFDMNAQRAVVLDQAGTFDVATGASVNLNGYMYGPGSLIKTGGGTLLMSAAQGGQAKFVGPVTVLGGTLVYLSSLAQNFSPSVVIPNYWTLDNNAALSIAFGNATNSTSTTRGITLQAGGGQLLMDNGGSLTFNGPIAGSGTLSKTGNGTVVLGAADTYLGGTKIQGGYLSIASDNRLGAAGTTVTLDGGTLVFSTLTSMTNRPIVVTANNGTLDTSAGSANNTAQELPAPPVRSPNRMETRSRPNPSESVAWIWKAAH